MEAEALVTKALDFVGHKVNPRRLAKPDIDVFGDAVAWRRDIKLLRHGVEDARAEDATHDTPLAAGLPLKVDDDLPADEVLERRRRRVDHIAPELALDC